MTPGMPPVLAPSPAMRRTLPATTPSTLRDLLDESGGRMGMGRSPTFPFPQWRARDAFRTVYFDEGQGPPLVFVHGLGGSITHWEFLAEGLVQGHRVAGLDLVGFGASGKPRIDYRVDLLADHLLDFLAARGIESATLVGHSLGGAVCLAAALRRPEVARGLVLIGAAGLAPLPLWMRVGSRLLLHPRVLFHSLQASADWILDQVLIDPPEENPYIRHFRLSSLQDDPGLPNLRDFARVSASICRDVIRQDYSRRLPELKVPVLVVWGDSDRLIGAPGVAQAMRAIPRLRQEILPRCGHMPMIERPREVIGMVTRFLDDPP